MRAEPPVQDLAKHALRTWCLWYLVGTFTVLSIRQTSRHLEERQAPRKPFKTLGYGRALTSLLCGGCGPRPQAGNYKVQVAREHEKVACQIRPLDAPFMAQDTGPVCGWTCVSDWLHGGLVVCSMPSGIKAYLAKTNRSLFGGCPMWVCLRFGALEHHITC